MENLDAFKVSAGWAMQLGLKEKFKLHFAIYLTGNLTTKLQVMSKLRAQHEQTKTVQFHMGGKTGTLSTRNNQIQKSMIYFERRALESAAHPPHRWFNIHDRFDKIWLPLPHFFIPFNRKR